MESFVHKRAFNACSCFEMGEQCTIRIPLVLKYDSPRPCRLILLGLSKLHSSALRISTLMRCMLGIPYNCILPFVVLTMILHSWLSLGNSYEDACAVIPELNPSINNLRVNITQSGSINRRITDLLYQETHLGMLHNWKYAGNSDFLKNDRNIEKRMVIYHGRKIELRTAIKYL